MATARHEWHRPATLASGLLAGIAFCLLALATLSIVLFTLVNIGKSNDMGKTITYLVFQIVLTAGSAWCGINLLRDALTWKEGQTGTILGSVGAYGTLLVLGALAIFVLPPVLNVGGLFQNAIACGVFALLAGACAIYAKMSWANNRLVAAASGTGAALLLLIGYMVGQSDMKGLEAVTGVSHTFYLGGEPTLGLIGALLVGGACLAAVALRGVPKLVSVLLLGIGGLLFAIGQLVTAGDTFNGFNHLDLAFKIDTFSGLHQLFSALAGISLFLCGIGVLAASAMAVAGNLPTTDTAPAPAPTTPARK